MMSLAGIDFDRSCGKCANEVSHRSSDTADNVQDVRCPFCLVVEAVSLATTLG
jgi:hypothetical protein